MTPDLNKAVESTWALVIARFVTPGVVAMTFALGGYIGNEALSEIKSLRVQVSDFQKNIGAMETEQARLDERQKFHSLMIESNNKRLDRLESKQPINAWRPGAFEAVLP